MAKPFGIAENQHSDVLFQFTDAAGRPAIAPTIDSGSMIAKASDSTAITVTPKSDLSGVTVTAKSPLDTAVILDVSCTVNGVKWSGSETFAVGAAAPTELTLVSQGR